MGPRNFQGNLGEGEILYIIWPDPVNLVPGKLYCEVFVVTVDGQNPANHQGC